ncbi:MAG: Asp23/Gls24 family envelope stress response protein [Armatimonadota bacterium]
MAENDAATLNEHATTLVAEKGNTIIADSVVAKIAGLAAREIEGVHSLVSTGLSQSVVGLARAVSRQQSRDTGITVAVGEKEATVDVRLCADYGVNLQAVAAAVRNNVIDRVQSMTGLIVKEVNVRIVDLYFPSEDSLEPVRAAE